MIDVEMLLQEIDSRVEQLEVPHGTPNLFKATLSAILQKLVSSTGTSPDRLGGKPKKTATRDSMNKMRSLSTQGKEKIKPDLTCLLQDSSEQEKPVENRVDEPLDHTQEQSFSSLSNERSPQSETRVCLPVATSQPDSTVEDTSNRFEEGADDGGWARVSSAQRI